MTVIPQFTVQFGRKEKRHGISGKTVDRGTVNRGTTVHTLVLHFFENVFIFIVSSPQTGSHKYI